MGVHRTWFTVSTSSLKPVKQVCFSWNYSMTSKSYKVLLFGKLSLSKFSSTNYASSPALKDSTTLLCQCSSINMKYSFITIKHHQKYRFHIRTSFDLPLLNGMFLIIAASWGKTAPSIRSDFHCFLVVSIPRHP
jgi:hypothetical protein